MAPVSGTRRQAWNVAALFAVAVFGVLAVVGPLPGVAQAAVTYHVTNANDSGEGSFRAAMAQAQVATEPVIIEFDAAYELMLQTSIATYSNGQPLTIMGNGSTVRAVAGVRALEITQVAPNPGDVMIEGLSFKDMAPTPGAAIHMMRASRLTLRDGTFENITGTFWSPALITHQTDVLIDGVTFRGNSSNSSASGAIFIGLGSLEIVDSHFIDNTANAGPGGALWVVEADPVTITNTTMHNNTAGGNGWGGALAMQGGSLTISGGSSLVGNRSTNGGGGAISIDVTSTLGPIRLDRVEMVNNEAALRGGAIVLLNNSGLAADVDLQARNAVFADNRSGSSGGAIAVVPGLAQTTVMVDVADTVFARNSASGVGGAIHIAQPGGSTESPYVAAQFLAANSNFVENSAGTGLHGGALSNWGNTTLVYSTVHENAGASQIQTTSTNPTLSGGNAHGELFTFATVIANPASDVGVNCAVVSWMSNFGHSYATDGTCAALNAQADPMLFFDAADSLRSWPQPGSPLLDAIPSAQCLPDYSAWWNFTAAAVPSTNLGFDQIGTERPQGAGCDIGAIEVIANGEPPALRTTELSFDCSPQPAVPTQQVDCTIFVTDIDDGVASAPEGSVQVELIGIGPWPSDCAVLSPQSDESSSCNFNVVSPSEGSATFAASYFGSGTHAFAYAEKVLTWQDAPPPPQPRATSTTLECTPLVQVTGESITCTATVNDVDQVDGASVPAGRFGIFNGFDTSYCSTLVQVDASSASCNFSIEGDGDFSVSLSLTAEYEGSDDHESSTSDLVTIEWELRATSTSLHCIPLTVDVDETIDCMVTVTDIDTRGTKGAPEGSVSVAITEGASTTNMSCSPLVPAGADSATCAFEMTRTAAVTLTVQARFDHPGVHAASDSETVTLRWMSISEPGGEGCSPGFWKNHPGAWPGNDLSGVMLGDLFEFSNALKSFRDVTLQASLDFRGGNGNAGAAEILLRAGTAAWLNALHSDVAYPLEAAEVLSRVQAALDGGRAAMLTLATELDEYNNLGCFVTTTR